jgi:hypothetical protein
MWGSLFDSDGVQKYLTGPERFAFARAAYREGGEIATFCLTLRLPGQGTVRRIAAGKGPSAN